MDRKKFLKIGALAGTGVVSSGFASVNYAKNFTRSICIYDNYIRGLAYYKKNISSIDWEAPLNEEIVREQNNQYDRFAIAVFVQEKKIGYIAAYENIVLAKMMDAGVQIRPEIVVDYLSDLDQIDYLSASIYIRLYAELVATDHQFADLEIQLRADDVDDEYRIGWKKIY